MLKKMYMINSADMNNVEIEFDGNLFFAGDNGSGKTTAIRALHYLFVTHSNLVGISGDQKPFNDYYFKEPKRSYLIYDFDKYFIIMYKDKYKLYKHFVRRKLNIDDFYDDNDNLVPHNEINKYMVTATSKKRVETRNDFNSIFYGDNEFSFNKIENVDTFIDLYSKLFNISKTIIDSNSIKEAIKDSIGQKKEFYEFDASSFYDSFYKLQHLNKFYKTYEKYNKTIHALMKSYKTIINLEEDLTIFSKKIEYRFDYESRKHIEIQDKIEKIEINMNVKKSYFIHIENRQKYLNKKLQSFINDLEVKLKEILMLEFEFTDKRLIKNKTHILRKDSLLNNQKKVQKNIIEIENQYKTLIETIENEIYQLKQSFKEEELQLKEEINIQKEQNNESIDEKYQELQLKKSEYEKDIELNIKKHKKNIAESEKHKNFELLKKEELINKYENKFDLLRFILDNNNKEINQEIQVLNKDKDSLFTELNRLRKEKVDKSNNYKKLVKANVERYEEDKSSLIEEKEYFRSLLDIDKNSFQAFLNENIDNWEHNLYPIIEKKLLVKDIKILQPKILDNENIFGISLNKDTLDTLPTKQEIQNEQENILNKLNILKNSYQKESKKLEKEYYEDNEKNESQIIHHNSKIKIQQLQVYEKENEVKKLLSHYENEKKIQNTNRENEKVTLDKSINNIKKTIEEEESKIKIFNHQMKLANKSYKDIFNKEKSNLKKLLNTSIENLNEKFENIKKEIENKVNEKDKGKYNISNEEKIKELNIELNFLNNNLSQISQSEAYLERYEKVKNKIKSKTKIEKDITKNIQFSNNLIELFTSNKNKSNIFIQEQTNLLNDFNEEKKLYKNGLNRFQNLNIELLNSCVETEESLDELISLYLISNDNHSSTVTLFRTDFEIVWKKIRAFNRLDLPLNLENFYELKNLSNIEDVKRSMYELSNYEYLIIKEKKNSTLELSSIIESSKQRLKNFDTSIKGLNRQITKINQRLKKIDFSVINSIKLCSEKTTGKNLGSYWSELKDILSDLEMNEENSLFNDDAKATRDIKKIIELLDEIKKTFRRR